MSKTAIIIATAASAVDFLPEGFTPSDAIDQSQREQIFNTSNIVWAERPGLEIDPTYRQLIPYALVRQNGNMLRYRRPAKTGEDRLAQKRSIGFGGHVESQDVGADVAGIVNETLRRELLEEIGLDINDPSHIRSAPKVIGFIKSNATEVDKVHLGIVYAIDVHNVDFSSEEAEIAELQFATPDDLTADGSLDSWSRLTIDASNTVTLGAA